MSSDRIKVAINGAAGRMGQRLIALSRQDKQLEVVCGVEIPGHPLIGQSLPDEPPIADGLIGGPAVVIDFSLPAGTQKMVTSAVNDKVAMVIGTTGLSKDQQNVIDYAAREIPIVQSANMSVGVNALLKLVAQAAQVLGAEYDIEIVEAHHRFKKDAPSGTAMALARSICQATGKDIDQALRHGRRGEAARVAGEIGMHAVRVGDTVGEHTVYFGNLGETVTLGHSAHTRDTFAMGALRAAKWVVGKPAGKYTMADVLFGG